MENIYLLSDEKLDKIFGLGPQPLNGSAPIGPKTYISNTMAEIHDYDPLNDVRKKMGDILIIQDIKDAGLVARLTLPDKKLLPKDISPAVNDGIRLKGNYLDELKNYLIGKDNYVRIIVSNSQISSQVKKDIEKIINDPETKAEIGDMQLKE